MGLGVRAHAGGVSVFGLIVSAHQHDDGTRIKGEVARKKRC